MYRLPNFHLVVDVYSAFVYPAIVLGSLISSSISCQINGYSRQGRIVMKCPKGVRIPFGAQISGTMDAIVDVPRGSNQWYQIVDYFPVAYGYPNAYEHYTLTYLTESPMPPTGT